ncbi:hypothetical protein AB3N04_00900 (plasmid) [Alkalihalophilus sp. As8PL]|uniref:Uncharacterized protein n=1 Tax=Alkalihalophilus sp. As8PL TaxID=3237103 RepID=A0AB39BMN7_9BACI
MGTIISFDHFKNNKSNHLIEKTCKNSCVFFDYKEESCPFFKLDYEDPTTPTRCMEYLDREEIEKDLPIEDEESGSWELLEDGYSVEGDENFMFEIIGQSSTIDTSSYPSEPDIPLSNQSTNLGWYVAPDRSFGCWIWNNSKHRLMQVNPNLTLNTVPKGWADKVYRSPIPLHAPNASDNVRSRMVWYVDEDGYGQYVLYMSNEIKMLSYPKPAWWS